MLNKVDCHNNLYKYVTHQQGCLRGSIVKFKTVWRKLHQYRESPPEELCDDSDELLCGKDDVPSLILSEA